MLATLAAADSAKVQKKSTALLYKAKYIYIYISIYSQTLRTKTALGEKKNGLCSQVSFVRGLSIDAIFIRVHRLHTIFFNSLFV